MIEWSARNTTAAAANTAALRLHDGKVGGAARINAATVTIRANLFVVRCCLFGIPSVLADEIVDTVLLVPHLGTFLSYHKRTLTLLEP